MDNSFLTPSQAANFLNISLSTLKKMIYQGRLSTFKTPGGHHRILKSHLLEAHQDQEFLSDPPVHQRGGENISQEAIMTFIAIIERRQHFAHGHAAAVSELSCGICRALGFSISEVRKVARAALLHDIGFIAISETVLNKSGPLSAGEYEIVRNHPRIGAEILGGFSFFEDIVPIIEQHHERPDGTGYPYGLTGESICLESKILAVAEAFHSMTATDSYQKSMTREDAMAEIRMGAGTQFDQGIVQAFQQSLKVWGKRRRGLAI